MLMLDSIFFKIVAGSVSTMLFGIVSNDLYWMGGLLLVVSNVFFGFSAILYNSYLPLLTENLPEVILARGTPDYDVVEEKYANQLSTRGFALVIFFLCHFKTSF